MTNKVRRNLYLTFANNINSNNDNDIYSLAKYDKELLINNITKQEYKNRHEIVESKLINLKNVNIKIYPFKYIILSDFLDLIYLKTLDYYLYNLDKTLYTKEGVPQFYMDKLDKKSLKENQIIKIYCQSEFNENNKSIKNSNEKKIKILEEPTEAQGINRCFIDINNIDDYPLLKVLISELTKKEFIEFLENHFDKKLNNTRLRVELLRNVKSHFLTPHCDCKEKYITLLIYVNMNNQPLDSGTDIYTKEDIEVNGDSLKRDFNNFKKVDSINFINNTALIFSPGNNTWHGLDKNKTHDDRRLLQINWVNEEYSSYSNCFKLQ